MKTTLAQAKESAYGIARVLAIGACDPRFSDYINQAQQRLADMGTWWGTYRRLFVCISNSCITWPRGVAVPLGFKLCDRGIEMFNEWYEFGEAVRSPETAGAEGLAPYLVERQNTCQFTDTTSNALIRIYPSVAADAGVKVLLQGLDPNGVPIRTVVGSTYVDGEQVTIASPFTTTTFEFMAPGLLGVQKPVTKGRLTAYSVDPSTGIETKIAIWEPSEVNPSYRRSFLASRPQCCGPQPVCSPNGNGCDQYPATPACGSPRGEAIARMDFIPALVDTDWLFISNIQAIASGCRALLAEERDQATKAMYEWEAAKRILRNELEKYSPAELTRVVTRPYGNAPFERVIGGMR